MEAKPQHTEMRRSMEMRKTFLVNELKAGTIPVQIVLAT
jgi:hypothetical protein